MFCVQGLGFRVEGLGFRVSSFGLRAWLPSRSTPHPAKSSSCARGGELRHSLSCSLSLSLDHTHSLTFSLSHTPSLSHTHTLPLCLSLRFADSEGHGPRQWPGCPRAPLRTLPGPAPAHTGGGSVYPSNHTPCEPRCRQVASLGQGPGRKPLVD